MRKIPEKLRRELAQEPFMQRCILSAAGIDHCCTGLEWHHPWTYNKKQINERWSIVPLCHEMHKKERLYRPLIELISILRATPKELLKYPAFDWSQRKKYVESQCQAIWKLDSKILQHRMGLE